MRRCVRPATLSTRCRSAVGLLLGCQMLLAACASGDTTSGGSADRATEPDALRVVASFYPLQYVTERIGGAHVRVQNLTPAGAEPHEIELTPANTADLVDSDLVVYLSGFAPAVDTAVDEVASAHALDVVPAARLDLGGSSTGGAESGDVGGAGDARAPDPHFWLDPTRLADVARAVEAQLTRLDPEHDAEFATNADRLINDLDTLDAEFRAGLTDCTSREIVTSHAAFAYLAERYDMTQIGITGVSPEVEPSSADLAQVSGFVEEHDVTTIYTETLVSPEIAETVAEETGATTGVLDPIEGLSDETQGSDYLGIMRADLIALRRGQGCT